MSTRSGRRRGGPRGRNRRQGAVRVLHPTPSLDTPVVVERLSRFDSIVGNGTYTSKRVGLTPLIIPEINTISLLYTEYRVAFFRVLIVPSGNASSLGSVFASYDFNSAVSAAPATYSLAVSTENVLVSSPSNAQTSTLTHRGAFQQEVFGSVSNALTIPMRSEQGQRWLLVGSNPTTAQVFVMLNYGANLLQAGLSGADVYVAYRIVFRGARAI
jgi:hypothetical protein